MEFERTLSDRVGFLFAMSVVLFSVIFFVSEGSISKVNPNSLGTSSLTLFAVLNPIPCVRSL